MDTPCIHLRIVARIFYIFSFSKILSRWQLFSRIPLPIAVFITAGRIWFWTCTEYCRQHQYYHYALHTFSIFVLSHSGQTCSSPCSNQNVSLHEYLHVDFWTPNSTSLDFYLISPGAETFYSLPITLESWVSVDIPLTDFVPPVDLTNVFQFKVVGNGTVYFDNWYFWKNPTAPGTDATLSDLQVDATTIPGFDPA